MSGGVGTESDPQMRGLATKPVPCRRVPRASEAGTKPPVAHKGEDWLHNPCHLGGSPTLQVGEKIRSGPHVGGLAA